jgi:hypothetical protein
MGPFQEMPSALARTVFVAGYGEPSRLFSSAPSRTGAGESESDAQRDTNSDADGNVAVHGSNSDANGNSDSDIPFAQFALLSGVAPWEAASQSTTSTRSPQKTAWNVVAFQYRQNGDGQ